MPSLSACKAGHDVQVTNFLYNPLTEFRMRIIKTFALSCVLLAELSASVLPSVVERFQTDDYAARQSARVELMAAFAESTAIRFDSEERGALENELLEQVVSDTIPLEGRLYLLRMLELYGTPVSAPTLALLAQDSDPILSEAAKRASRGIEGKIVRPELPLDYTTSLGRMSAYRSLLTTNPARALEVTRQTLADPDAIGRVRILTIAAHAEQEQISELVLPALLEGSEAEQLIAVVAINENELPGYESVVLQILPQAAGQLRNEVVACLGVIGGDESFAALYALYQTDPKNQDVQAALARVRAPSADDQALRGASKGSDAQARVAAVKLLALRNPAGATTLLNGLLQDGGNMNIEIRKAIYQALEQIGDIESVHILLDPKLILGEYKRDTQLSLKRLSLSLGIPDYLWAEVYQPTLVANDDSDYRAAILEILDGVACEGSVEYLKSILKDPSSPDYALAYRSLQRWPQGKDLYTADMWLLVYAADTASDADRQKAEAALKKILENKHPNFYQAQIDLLLRVGKSDLPVEFKHRVFAVYAEPQEHFNSWYHPSAKRLLQPAVAIPDVAEIAQEMINKL